MDDAVLQSYVNTFSDEHDLAGLQPGEIFEHFVNFSIISKRYPRNFEYEDASVGGTDDAGLDGVAIIVNGTFITSEEEVLELARRNGYLDVSFNFIQSKSARPFKSDEVGTFLFGIKNFFDAKSSVPENDDVRALRKIKEIIYSKSIEFTNPPDLNMYFVTTGSWKDPGPVRGRATGELKELEQRKLFRAVGFNFIDAEKLKEIYRELQRRVVKEVNFTYQTPLPEMEGVKRSFLGALPAKEFVKLISDTDGNLQKSIFFDNVRDYQGGVKVNTEIEQTLRDPVKQSRLAILNNGVTLIAKQVEQIGSKLKLSDFQIVNGCQTSNLIFDAFGYLSDTAYVPLKIIETTDQEIINEVIKATNRQTEVKLEAFESLTPFHKDLEEYFNSRAKGTKYPIFYERRSKQYQGSPNTKPHQVISLATQIKAFVSAFLEQPHSTHRYYGELLESYRDRLFSGEHALVGYYASALIFQRLTHLFDIKKIDPKYRMFKYQMILAYAKRFVHVPQLRGAEFESGCERMIASLENLANLMQVIGVCTKVLDKAEAEAHLPRQVAVRSKDFTTLIIGKHRGR